jgi:hypothetical protein
MYDRCSKKRIIGTETKGNKHDLYYSDIEIKFKAHPVTGHEGPEGEKRYSSTLSLTSAGDGLGDQRHTPAFYPRKRYPVPIVQEAGWAQGPV